MIPDTTYPPVPCPLCGGEAYTPLKRFSDGVVVARCLGCGLLHAAERHPAPETVLAPGDLEGLRERYRAVLDGTAHHYRRDHYRAYLDVLARHTPGPRLLDVGCAHGFLGREARARGFTVSGVEPHPGMAAFAREENGMDVLAGTIADVDLGERRFDAVTFTDSFEYVPHPVEALRKIGAHLAPGGVVFAKVPNGLNALLRHRLERMGIGGGAGAFSPSRRVTHYTTETLTRTFEAAGFTVVETGFPRPIHSPTRAAEREGRAEIPLRPWEALPSRAVRTLLQVAGRAEAAVASGRNHLAQSIYVVGRSGE